MSSSYSANQYDSAFKPHRLQNWCEPKHFKERPTVHGHTTFIADNSGHLLPGVRKRGPAWSDYKDTWNLPAHTPVQRINPTARSVEGLNRLKSWGMYPMDTDMSQPHRGTKSTNRLQTSGKLLQDSATPSAAAEAQTASENHPTPGNNPHPEPGRLAGSRTSYRVLTQCSAAEDEAALTPAAGEGIHSRPDTGEGRATSNVSANAARQASPPPSEQRQRDIQQDQ